MGMGTKGRIRIGTVDVGKCGILRMGVVAGALSGFKQWISVQAIPDIHVALFDNTGYQVSDGFHTLTATGTPPGHINEYNAFVYGHGPVGTHTSYGYLAGYDRKRNSTHSEAV